MRRKKLLAAVFGVFLVGAMTVPAHAAQISGSFGIAGNFRWVDENGAAATLSGGAVALDFNDNATADSGIFLVLNASGDFAANGLAFGTPGTIKDVRYTGSGGIYPNPPLVAFETVAGFTLELTGIDTVNIDSVPSLAIAGHGVFRHALFEDTPGTFTFSGQCASAEGLGCTAFTFSASNVAPVPTERVPEPGTMMLLGLGLVGMGWTAWRRPLK